MRMEWSLLVIFVITASSTSKHMSSISYSFTTNESLLCYTLLYFVVCPVFGIYMILILINMMKKKTTKNICDMGIKNKKSK